MAGEAFVCRSDTHEARFVRFGGYAKLPAIFARNIRGTLLILLCSTSVVALSPVLLPAISTPAKAQGGAASAAAAPGGADSVSGTGGAGASDFSSGSTSQYRGGGGGGSGAIGGAGGRGYGNPYAAAAGGSSPGATGADGAAGGDASGNGGGGGAHGFVGSLPTSATTGGNGGSGGASSSGAGGGGAGGYGAVVSGNGTLSGNVSGGNGGNGGTGFTMGSGGSGGIGLLVQGSTGISVNGNVTISGGNGGSTQDGSGIFGAAGSGGAGGNGVDVRSTGLVLTNDGVIKGGDGRIGGNGGPGIANGPPGTGPRYSGTDGAGGIGITGAGLTVVNSGTITGGLGYVNRASVRANAVTFTGGVNSLTITSTSQITGRVNAFSTADTFGLGGATNATFSLDQLGVTGSAAQYRGFGILEKSGSSTWTLTGTGSIPLTYSITGGTLDLDGGTQNAVSLLLTGGTLQNGTLSSDGSFELHSGNVSASLAGAGSLTKTSSGTVVLSGTNSYSGATTIAGGVLAINSSAAIGDGTQTNTLRFDGGLLRATGDVVSPAARGMQMLGSGEIDTNGNTVDIAGNIDGTGTLTKSGGGKLALSGENENFDGAIVVNAGTLAIESDTALGSSVAGTTIGAGATLTLEGGISIGTEALTVSGSGVAGTGAVTNISGENSLSGPITLAGDTLFSSEAGLITLSGTLDGDVAGRVVNIGGAGNGAISGNIGSNIGGLIKRDTGVWKLSGVNLYSGPTIIEAGTLQADSSDALGNAGATNILVFDGGTLQATGDIVSGSTRDIEVLGTGAIDTNGHVTSFAGIVTAAGQLSKTGLGNLILSGSNTSAQSFSGFMLIDGGTLTIDGLFGDLDTAGGLNEAVVRVLSGGTLSGSGRIAGTVLVEGGQLAGDLLVTGTTEIGSAGILSGNGTVGGDLVLGAGSTLAPGNSPGTITVLGNTTFASGSIYNVETVPGSTVSDLIDVTGSVTINGGYVRHVGLAGVYAPSQTYTIISASGGVTGQFDSVSSSYLFLTPTLLYGTTTVDLKLDRNDISFTKVAATANQYAVAEGLDGVTNGTTVKTVVTALSDPADAQRAFDLLSGEIYASITTGLFEDSRFVQEAMSQGMMTTEVPKQSSRDLGQSEMSGHATSVWMSGFGAWGQNDGDGVSATMERDTQGILFGVDGLATDDIKLGLAAGWSSSKQRVDERASSASIETGHIGIYAGTAIGGTALKAGASYGRSDVDVTRSVNFSGFSDSLSSEFTAHTTQVFAEISHPFQASTSVRLEPFANLSYVNINSGGFSETGGTAALTSVGGSEDQIFSKIGVRGSSPLFLGSTEFAVNGSLGWRHAFDTDVSKSLRFNAGDTTFAVAGTPMSKNAALVQFGLSGEISPNARLSVDYTGQFGDSSSANSVKARLGVNF